MAPFPDLLNVVTPTRAIITIATSIYRYGNGDDAEEGLLRDGAMGGSMWSTRPTKPVAVAVWFGL